MRPSHTSSVRLSPSAVAFLTVLFVTVWASMAPLRSQEVRRSVIPVASQWPGSTGAWQIDISDDGRYVVYQTNRGDGWKLFVHELGQPASREIVGLGDTPYYGTVSPDGKWLLFGKKQWIWKAPLSGREMSLVYPMNNSKTWETNDTFIVTKGVNGLWRVKVDGSRQDEQLAPVDKASGATNYGRPALLPNGRGVILSVGFGTGLDLRKIGIVSIPSGRLTLLDEYGIHPRYSESGHLLYTQGSTLKAIPFDVETLSVRGPSATVVEGIHVYSNQTSQFDISRTGVLVYVPGRSDLGRVLPRRLVWVDRNGQETPFDTSAEKLFNMVRLSPDGRFVATEVGSAVTVLDRRSGTWSVLSEANQSANAPTPTWSRDNSAVFYSRSGVLGRHSVQLGSTWEMVWKGDRPFWALAVSGDGKQLLGVEMLPGPPYRRLARVAVERASSAEPLFGISQVNRRGPALSPDGKWLAYVEKVGGLDAVYVQPFPDGGPAVLASAGAAEEASEPLWGRSSHELFYRDAVHLVSVELETAPALRVKRRTPLFDASPYVRWLTTSAALHDYDPRTDRFLMARWAIPYPPAQDIQVIENAFDLLNRIAPRR